MGNFVVAKPSAVRYTATPKPAGEWIVRCSPAQPPKQRMKMKPTLLAGVSVLGLALCGVAFAAPETAETAAAKPARAVAFKGQATGIDKSAKTFTIEGKKASKTIKVTDKTTVTKDGAPAQFSELTDDTLVTGSYWKHEDGTMEAKTLKIGGPTEAEKAAKAKKKASKEEKEGAAPTAPSPTPKK